MKQHDVIFVANGRGKARCAANPQYPNGVKVDVAGSSPHSCEVEITPYPAPECGSFVIQCKFCRQAVAVTAAGRADDPISVKMACDISILEGMTTTRLM